MAFCNSCGADITPGTRFCNKCGAAVLVSAPAPTVTPAVAPPVYTSPGPVPSSGGSALKIVLIVLGVLVLLGILGAASVGFLAWRVTRHAHIRHNGDDVKVETPFGNVETTKDAGEAARAIGVDIYPGAVVEKDGSSSVTFGQVHTSSLNAETTDSVEKVCNFYKPKFPNAMVVSNDPNECSIVSSIEKNMITISVQQEGGKTMIVITNVSKTKAAGSSSD